MNHLKRKSLIENFNSFVKKLSDKDVLEISLYITTKFDSNPPNNITKEFIDEFIGNDDWAVFVQDYRTGHNSLFRPFILVSEINEIRSLIMFEVTLRFNKLLNKKVVKKVDLIPKLKVDLKSAIDNSFEDDIFSKVDGWCNVSDVLVKYKLINLE